MIYFTEREYEKIVGEKFSDSWKEGEHFLYALFDYTSEFEDEYPSFLCKVIFKVEYYTDEEIEQDPNLDYLDAGENIAISLEEAVNIYLDEGLDYTEDIRFSDFDVFDFILKEEYDALMSDSEEIQEGTKEFLQALKDIEEEIE